jgi:gamma-glutamyl hercynylcysteine S-oxide synthase
MEQLSIRNDPTLSPGWDHARARSDEIFSLLPVPVLLERPIPERHRFLFYLGHLEAFDWNLLGVRSWGLASPQPELDRLFAFGIDPQEGDRPNDAASDWPEPKAVFAYVRRTRESLDEHRLRLVGPESRSTPPDGRGFGSVRPMTTGACFRWPSSIA